MNDATGAANTRDGRAAALLAHYERAGYVRAEPALLQPAEPFLDLSGEDIRRRMYLTTDAAGHELCLRPDLTIPVSCDYLASPAAGKPMGFCYLGPVFRYRADGPGEFAQGGIESFGRRDIAAADAEMISLGLEATSHYAIDTPDLRMGDVGLFAALINALELAPAWKRRLVKDFNRAGSLRHDLDRLALTAAQARPEYQGVLAALAGSDPRAAHALVTNLLSIAGITAVGGRSVGEIADRFLEQAALGAGNPDDAAADLRALAGEAGLALGPALDLFESRTGFMAARGVDVSRIRFSTAFGRGLDYYTGMVFELHPPTLASPASGGGKGRGSTPGQLVAGGRYDGLLSRLGAREPIPAVGFAVWVERLAAIGGAP